MVREFTHKITRKQYELSIQLYDAQDIYRGRLKPKYVIEESKSVSQKFSPISYTNWPYYKSLSGLTYNPELDTLGDLEFSPDLKYKLRSFKCW